MGKRCLAAALSACLLACGGREQQGPVASGGAHSASIAAMDAGAEDGGAPSGVASSGPARGGTPNAAASESEGGGCFVDGTSELVTDAKSCETDLDCSYVQTFSCCGPSVIVGLGRNAERYRNCYASIEMLHCPSGLLCYGTAQAEDQSSPAELADVVSRCYLRSSGERLCSTTIRGSCWDGATRCNAGETCTNLCGYACTCENGFMHCKLGANGEPCLPGPPK